MNTNKKLRFMIIVMAGFFIGQESLCAFSFGNFFKRYEKKKPADIIKDLEDQLIDDPKNPQINYNLGVAQYQLNHFNDAKHNFERAALYGDKAAFKEQAYFNFATCLLKNTLSMLPQNWKNPDQEIDPNLLETAINEISNAIKQYESVLLINEKNEKAISNKKESEKILRKLLEKKKQQEEKDQNQKDNKDNKDDQDQTQDQQEQDKNKQNKDNQKNNKNDQQTKDQDQKSRDNQDSSGQDQNSQKQDKQEQQEQSKKDSNDSSKNDDAQSQNNSQKDEPEQRGEKESANDQDEHKEPGSKRPEKKNGAEQEKKDVDHNEHDKKDNEQAKSTPAQPTQAEDEKQENENTQSGNTGFGDQEDSTEKRAYRAILDNLDTDESKLQKHLIMQKAKGQKPPVGSMQKPW